MNLKPILWIAGTMLCIAATSASAQVVVYKCGPRSYSQHPCSKRIVNTDDAPVHRKPNPKEVDVHRSEQNRALARSTRRLPGETSAEFQVRRHRARLRAGGQALPHRRHRLHRPNPKTRHVFAMS